MPRIVACPTCRTEVVWDASSLWRPFCSERCKAIDLGDWATDRFSIAGDPLQATREFTSPADRAN